MYYWSRDIIFVLCGWDYYTIILIKSWEKFQGSKCNLSHQLFLAFSSFLSTICFLYFFSFETWPSVSFVLAWTTPSSVFVSCFFFFFLLAVRPREAASNSAAFFLFSFRATELSLASSVACRTARAHRSCCRRRLEPIKEAIWSLYLGLQNPQGNSLQFLYFQL